MAVKADWNPGAYAAFRDLRLRPALDLLAQVPDLPVGDVIDLGCGAGAVGPALAARFKRNHGLVGVDASAAMLAEASKLIDPQGNRLYDGLTQADIALWAAHSPPALIFSNAALHWLGDHAALMPRLAGRLAPAGVLAIQMPNNFMAPSHRFLRDIAMSMFPDRFDLTGWAPPVHGPAEYWQMLSGFGDLQIWETDYLQHLGANAQGHPVRAFTESTAMRPYVEKLTPPETARFVAAYDQALQSAYPLLPDGTALMRFRRLFLVLRRSD